MRYSGDMKFNVLKAPSYFFPILSLDYVFTDASRLLSFFARRFGFQFEYRNVGDQGIGLWKLSLGKKRSDTFVKRIVIVPGLGDSPLSWILVLRKLHSTLTDHFDELILLDFPGFPGPLGRKKAFSSMDHMREATAQILDSLQPHTVIGHSLGGWLSAYYGVLCGKRREDSSRSNFFKGPKHLILGNPSGLDSLEIDMEKWGGKFLDSGEGGQEEFWDPALNRAINSIPGLSKLLFGELIRFMKKKEIYQFVRSCDPRHLLTGELKHIKSNVTVFWGEEDEINPASWMDEWIKELKGSDIEFVPIRMKECGHVPQLQCPRRLAKILKSVIQTQ